MPGGDRTGPTGLGPMTGRGLGWCYGPRAGGCFPAGYGRFGAFGFGRGRGWRHGYHASGLPGWGAQPAGGGWGAHPGYGYISAQDEVNYLKEYTVRLQDELNAMRARMVELESAGKSE